jgi:AcrR family transcriptional regulator
VKRDRKQTRAAILDAVGRLLAQAGFRDLGINAVAREAGVDKVLIYRYFGGLPELLKAFAEETDFWPDLPELLREAGEPAAAMTELERAKLMVVAFGRALRRRRLTQEIMRWELLERNELTEALARYREQQAEKLFRDFGQLADADIHAIGSLLAAGQTYLILRAKSSDVYNGLSLNSEEDWRRIEQAASFLVEAAFAKAEMKPKKKAARKARGTGSKKRAEDGNRP